MSDNHQLQEALSDEKNVKPFPKEFIAALRKLLDTGLSCAQIVSFMIVLQGMSELQDDYEEGELLVKASEILRIMRYLKTLDKIQGDGDDWFKASIDD